MTEHLSSIAKRGGQARMAGLSEKEREENARNAGKVGGKARASKLTPEQRSAIARRAALAMWAKRKRDAPE